ncbi:hypothetical protein LOD99_3513 [Oopsacas minuta]|uniref:Uncharacterized protein n=1 Tax=Oopsacas minuta TaxID=111878 RepID=A0AAV7JY28_9METZ|nr:hypothetical protein LOD99_3513 [Oopsacas minuta]
MSIYYDYSDDVSPVPLNIDLSYSHTDSYIVSPNLLHTIGDLECSHKEQNSIQDIVSEQLLVEWESYLREESESSKLNKLKSFLECFLSLYSIQPTQAIASFPGDISFVCTLLAKELITLVNQIKLDIYKEPDSLTSHHIQPKNCLRSCDKLEYLSNDFGYLLLHTLNILCGQVSPGHVELPLKILLILKQIIPNLDLSKPQRILSEIAEQNFANVKFISIDELSNRNIKVRQILFDPLQIERGTRGEYASSDVLLSEWSQSNKYSNNFEIFSEKIDSLCAKSNIEIVVILLSLFENLVQTESIIGNAIKIHVCLVHGLMDVHKKICDQEIFAFSDTKPDEDISQSAVSLRMLFLRLSLRVSFSELLLVSRHTQVLLFLLKTAPTATFSFLKNTLQLPTHTNHIGFKTVICEALNGTMLIGKMIVARLDSLGAKQRCVLIEFLEFLGENLFSIIPETIRKIDENYEESSELDSHNSNLLIVTLKSANASLINFLDELFKISFEELKSYANTLASSLINLIISKDVGIWIMSHLLFALRNSKSSPEIIHALTFSPFLNNISKFHDNPDIQSQILDIIENTLIRMSDHEENSYHSKFVRKTISWKFLEIYQLMLSPTTHLRSGPGKLIGVQERKALLNHLARLLHLGGFQLRKTVVFQVLFPLLVAINRYITNKPVSSPEEIIIIEPDIIKEEAVSLLELVSSSLQLLSKTSKLREHGEFFFEDGVEKELYENYLEILFSWIGNQNELRKAVIKSLKCVCMRESRQFFTCKVSFNRTSESIIVPSHPLNIDDPLASLSKSMNFADDNEEMRFQTIPLRNGTFLFGLILGLSTLPDPTNTLASSELWSYAHENYELKLNSDTSIKRALSELYLSPDFGNIINNLPAILSRLELHRDLWRAVAEILSHQHPSSSFLAQWIIGHKLDDLFVTCAHGLGKFMKKLNEFLNYNMDCPNALLQISAVLVSMFTYAISIKGLCCVVSLKTDLPRSKSLQGLKRLIKSLNGDCLKEIDFYKCPSGKYYVYTLMSLSTLTLVNPHHLKKNYHGHGFNDVDHYPMNSDLYLGRLFTNSIRDISQSQTIESHDQGYVAEVEDYFSPDLSFSVKKKTPRIVQEAPIIYFPEAVRQVFILFEMSFAPHNLTHELLKDALPTFELLLEILKSPYNLHILHLLQIFSKLIKICGHILVDNKSMAESECGEMITRILKILGKYSINPQQLKQLLLLFHKANYTHKIAEILAYISDFSKDGLVPPCCFISFPLTSLKFDFMSKEQHTTKLRFWELKGHENSLIPEAITKSEHKPHYIRLPKTDFTMLAGASFSIWMSVSPGLQSTPIFSIEMTDSFSAVTHRLVITASDQSRSIKVTPITMKTKTGQAFSTNFECVEFENVLRPGMWQNLGVSVWYDKEHKGTHGIRVFLLLYVDGSKIDEVKEIKFTEPRPNHCLSLWHVVIGGDVPDIRLISGVGSTNWKFCSLVVYRAILGSKEMYHIYRRGPHVASPYGLFNDQTIKNGELPGFLFSYSAFEHCTLLYSRSKGLPDAINDAVEIKMIDDQSLLIQPQKLPHLPDVLHCWGGISALLYLIAMLVRDGDPNNEYPVYLVLQTIKSCCELHRFTNESMIQLNGIVLLSRVFETSKAPIGEQILELFLSWCKDYNGRICSPEILQYILLNWRIWNRCQPVWKCLLKKLNNFLTVDGNIEIFRNTKALHRLLFSLQERSLDKSLSPLSLEVATQYLILIRSLVEQQFDDKKTFQINLRLITEFFFVSQLHPDPVEKSIRVTRVNLTDFMESSRNINSDISPSGFIDIRTPENSLFPGNPIINNILNLPDIDDIDTVHTQNLPDSMFPNQPQTHNTDLYSSFTNSVNITIELEVLNLIFSVLVNTPDSLSYVFFEDDTPLKPEILLHDSCMYTVCHRTKVIDTLRILYLRVTEIHRHRFMEMRGFHVLGVKLSKHSVSRDLVEACFRWISPAIKLNLAGELGLTDRTIPSFNLHAAILIFYIIEPCALACVKTCHQSLLLLMKLFQDIPNFANLSYKEHLLENFYIFAFQLKATKKFDLIAEDDKVLLFKDIRTFFQIICFYAIISPSLFNMLEDFLTFFHSYEMKCMGDQEYQIGLQFSRVVQYLALKESFTIILNMDTSKIIPPLSIGKIVEQEDLSKRFKELISRALGIVLFTTPVFTEGNSTFYAPTVGTNSYHLNEQSEEFAMLDASITIIISDFNYTSSDIQNVDWLFSSMILLKLSEILLSLRRELYMKYESAKKNRNFVDKHNHLSQFFKLFSFMLDTKRPKILRSYTIWCMLHHKTCRSLVKDIAGDEKSSVFYDCKDSRERFLIRLVYKASELFHQFSPDPSFFPPEKCQPVIDFFDNILERKQKSYLPRSFAKFADIWNERTKSEYSKLTEVNNTWKKEENESRTYWNQDMDNHRATVIEGWRRDKKATQESKEQIDEIALELQVRIKQSALQNLREWHTHVLGCLHSWRFLIQNMMHDRSLWFGDDNRHKIWGLDPTEGPNRIRMRLMQMPCDIQPEFFYGNKQFSTDTKHPMIYLFLDLPEHLKDIQLNEKPPYDDIILDKPCSSISQDHKRNGTLIITLKEVFFFSDQPLKEISHTKLLPYDSECTAVSWKIADLAHIYQRLCKLKDIALEFCLHNGHTLFLEFEGKKDRDDVYDKILYLHTGKLKNNMNTKLKDRVEECIAKWRQGGSNFQLIMDLNQLAGRTFNDLMQYPVFPFVLNDYTSNELNLEDSKSFRDLSLPLPAQSEQGRSKLTENYNETEHELMYTSLYSNTPSVLYFLIRIPPFTQQFIVFQGGKFDCADRSFHNIQTIWNQNTEPGSKSFKELIPEFFYFPEIFLNRADLNLGVRQCKSLVTDVELPSWASNDPRLFVLKHREALESPFVSKNIHKWLDLIFGCKQRDEGAINSYNVFDKRLYSFSDMPEYDRFVQLKMLEHTGQVPKQLMPSKQFPAKDYTLTRMPLGILPVAMVGSTSRKSPTTSFLNNIADIDIIHLIPYDNEYFIGKSRKQYPDLEIKESQSHKREKTITQLTYYENDFALIAVSGNNCISLRSKRSHGEFQGVVALLRWDFWDDHIEFRELKEKTTSSCYVYGHPLEKITVCQFIDSEVFITGSSMGVVTYWQTQRDQKDILITAKPSFLHGHSEPVTALAVCIPYSIMVSGSADRSIIVWDINRIAFVRSISTPKEAGDVTCIAISHTLGDISVACESGGGGSTLSVWTINGQFVKQLNVNVGITCMQYTAALEGVYVNVLVTGHRDGWVRFLSSWNLTIIRELNTYTNNNITALAFGPSYKEIVVASENGCVSLWNLQPRYH